MSALLRNAALKKKICVAVKESIKGYVAFVPGSKPAFLGLNVALGCGHALGNRFVLLKVMYGHP